MHIRYKEQKKPHWGCDERCVKRDLEIDLLQYVSRKSYTCICISDKNEERQGGVGVGVHKVYTFFLAIKIERCASFFSVATCRDVWVGGWDCVYMYVYVYMYTCIYTNVCMRVCMCVCMLISMYVFICIYTHTHTHTNTHTHTP
jgi:hypothetical protein